MNINLVNLFSNNDKPQIPALRIDNAVMAIVTGLEFVIGKPRQSDDGFGEGGYTWISAYDEVAGWLQDNRLWNKEKTEHIGSTKGLLLMGANGTGKTTIEKILQRIIDRYFNTETDFVNKCSFTSASNIQEAWERYCRYQIIDDIGKESIANNYGEQHSYFAEIIDRAEQNGQLLICSTNLSGKELMDKYGARTMDRMNHILLPVLFKGDSFRH